MLLQQTFEFNIKACGLIVRKVLKHLTYCKSIRSFIKVFELITKANDFTIMLYSKSIGLYYKRTRIYSGRI